MTLNPAGEFSLAALISRHEAVSSEVQGLEQRLARLRQDENDLRVAVDALRRVFGAEVDEVDDGDHIETPTPPAGVHESVSTEGRAEMPDSENPTEPTSRRRRIRSTQMVVDYLKSASEPKTREELLAYFSEIGIAENWRNPENAVATAASRAVASGNVHELPDGRLIHSTVDPAPFLPEPLVGASSQQGAD